MKQFSDPRWHDTILPDVVDSREQTEEEKKREKEFNEQFEKWLKNRKLKRQSKKNQTN